MLCPPARPATPSKLSATQRDDVRHRHTSSIPQNVPDSIITGKMALFLTYNIYVYGTVSVRYRRASCIGPDWTGRRTARYNYNTRKPVLVMSPVTSRGWVTYTHTGVLERVPHRCRAFFSPICGGAFQGREDGGGKIRERTSTISSCTSSMLPLPKCAVRWLALARDRCKEAPNMLQDVLRWYFHSFF